jgi:hypothetical protein
MGVDDKTDELTPAERFELFFSALHIKMILISYNNL